MPGVKLLEGGSLSFAGTFDSMPVDATPVETVHSGDYYERRDGRRRDRDGHPALGPARPFTADEQS